VDYELQADLEAVRFVLSLKRSDCTRLIRWMDQLKDLPFTEGQLTVLDATGREIQVSKMDKFLVYHWTDHPVKTVRVLKIEINA
jgi:hypothetical protein